MPLPVTESKLSFSPRSAGRAPRSRAPATIAAASGCSLAVSSPATRPSSSRSPTAAKPSASAKSVSFGLPSVSVPVLSTTSVSTVPSSSIVSALRNRTPSEAPRPIATMIDIGVASPRAHGQAMISTATALTRACARRGSGPSIAHSAKVATAIAITARTKTAETRSASFWIGARLRCAAATMATMRASSVSPPTFSARMTSAPLPLIVAPTTFAPADFSTGIGSPETIDSSTALRPSRTRPSTGIFSPGRTRNRSPTRTSPNATSVSLPSAAIRRAEVAWRPSSLFSADPVSPRALSSSTWPNSTRTVITAAASK